MRGLVRLVRNVGSYVDAESALGGIVRGLVEELGLEGAGIWRIDGERIELVHTAGAPIDAAFARTARDEPRREAERVAWPLHIGNRTLGVLAARGAIEEPVAAVTGMLAGRCAHILNDARRATTQRSLLEGLSHELRAPLQSLLGHVDLLAGGSFGILTDAQAEAVETISHSAEKILAVTRDVLQVAAIDSGRDHVIAGAVALPEVLRLEVDAARPLADRAGLALELECPAELSVVSDGAKIGRIVTNLLSNAIKYTPDGRVTVRAGTEDGRAFIEVADTGQGIPPDLQDAVFHEYVRADESRDGTGLGLAITRRLSDLLGARLTLASEPGRGTTVRLTLPA